MQNRKQLRMLNQRVQAIIVMTMIVAALMMLSLLPRLSTVQATNGSGDLPGYEQRVVSYQISGTVTHTLYMPYLRRDPTPTATATPQFVFFDDFNGNNKGWYTGLDSSENCEFRYEGGVYKVIIEDDGGFKCVAPAFPVDDEVPYGTFSIRARRTSSSSRELHYGFYFGAGSKAEEDRWFVEVHPFEVKDCSGEDRGFFWVSAIEDKKEEFFKSVCTSSVDTDEDDWNEIKVERTTSTIKFFINGDMKLELDTSDNVDDILKDKGFFDLVVVGVDGISSSSPGRVEFDDFKISR